MATANLPVVHAEATEAIVLQAPRLTLPARQNTSLYFIAPAMKPLSSALHLLDESEEVTPANGEVLGLAVYRLEVAPVWAFEDWLATIVKAQASLGALEGIVLLLSIDRKRWIAQDRLRMIRVLEEAGINLPLFSLPEAQATLKAAKEAQKAMEVAL